MELVLMKNKRNEDHLWGFQNSWTKNSTALIRSSFNTHVNGVNISFWQMTKKLWWINIGIMLLIQFVTLQKGNIYPVLVLVLLGMYNSKLVFIDQISTFP